jgi:hypothetical protein
MLQFIINRQVFFSLHRNLESQIFNYNNASFNFNNEGHYVQIDSMIHNFLDALKIMDYENIIYLLPQVKTFTY